MSEEKFKTAMNKQVENIFRIMHDLEGTSNDKSIRALRKMAADICKIRDTPREATTKAAKSELLKNAHRLEELNIRLVSALQPFVDEWGSPSSDFTWMMIQDAKDAIYMASASARPAKTASTFVPTHSAAYPYQHCPRCHERITERNYLLFEYDRYSIEMDRLREDEMVPEYMCVACYNAFIDEI